MLYSLALVALGVIGYLATGRESATALIPTAFGIVALAVLMATSRAGRPALGATIVAVLAVLGIAGTARAFPAIADLLGGSEVARPAAIICQGLMALFSLLFILIWFRFRRVPKAA
jgi:hypothetical protein